MDEQELFDGYLCESSLRGGAGLRYLPSGARPCGSAFFLPDLPRLGDEVSVFKNRLFALETLFQIPGTAGAVEETENWGGTVAGMDIERIWRHGARGAGVRIGMADSGLDLDAPALRKLVAEKRFISFAHFDHQGRKVVQCGDDGGPIADSAAVPTYHAPFWNWHGTHCATILVGEKTNGFLRGVAPDAELVFARFEGSYASFKACFAWLAEQECDLFSLSLGMDGKHEIWAPEIRALCAEERVVVAAAGNEFTTESYPRTRSPGNYPVHGLISVGAHARDGSIWERSGGEWVDWEDVVIDDLGLPRPSAFAGAARRLVPDVVAPGVDIVSSTPGNTYEAQTGTSMATPHVAGLIATVLSILRSTSKRVSARTAAGLVMGCVRDVLPAGPDIRSGYGRIDISALDEAIATTRKSLM